MKGVLMTIASLMSGMCPWTKNLAATERQLAPKLVPLPTNYSSTLKNNHQQM